MSPVTDPKKPYRVARAPLLVPFSIYYHHHHHHHHYHFHHHRRRRRRRRVSSVATVYRKIAICPPREENRLIVELDAR